MKVIFSRKGLDSQYGGIPSPIIKTEYGYKFFPIPIPDKFSNVKYSDLSLLDGFKVTDFLKDIPLRRRAMDTCHLDPDIRKSYLAQRPQGWKRAFGQSGAAQGHLKKMGVGKGDVFLFFGWFKFAEHRNGRFQWVRSKEYPNGFHAIYGYLQVDKLIDPLTDQVPGWLKKHPNVEYLNFPERDTKGNMIYTAADFFQYKNQNVEKNGSILFAFADDLVLTKKGQGNRTDWELPGIFHPENGVQISHNPAKNWKKQNGNAVLRSAPIGQEFVVFSDPSGNIESWCLDLILKHQVTD